MKKKRHPLFRTPEVEYECGNARSIYDGIPDRCPECNAEIKTNREP